MLSVIISWLTARLEGYAGVGREGRGFASLCGSAAMTRFSKLVMTCGGNAELEVQKAADFSAKLFSARPGSR